MEIQKYRKRHEEKAAVKTLRQGRRRRGKRNKVLKHEYRQAGR